MEARYRFMHMEGEIGGLRLLCRRNTRRSRRQRPSYLAPYPLIRICTPFLFIIFIHIIPLPAWVILAYWFVIQVASGASLPAAGAGVAYWAHIGGFVAGLLLVKPLENKDLVEAKRRCVKLDRKDIRRGGWW